ncbi:MAG: hypothetical protein L0I24_25055 [Pseudonocardia sp.]|nr:hypothetical protein [Pseudonocardia sp.]
MTASRTALAVIPEPRLPAPGEAVPPPRVVPGEVVQVVQECVGRPVHNQPYAPPWAITDPDEITATQERIKWHSAPWWWRLTHPRPPEPTHLTPYPVEARRD